MTAMTTTQRVAEYQARKVKAGGRILRVMLSPEAAAALDTLTADGSTMTAVIERALIEGAQRRRGIEASNPEYSVRA